MREIGGDGQGLPGGAAPSCHIRRRFPPPLPGLSARRAHRQRRAKAGA